MGLLDVLQGASNAAASNVSGPVDMLAWALRKAGVPVPQNPVMGEQWMREKGLLADPQNKYAGAAGETLGLLGPIGAAAKAPQIARGLLAGEEAGKRGAYAVGEKANDMAGNYMAQQGLQRNIFMGEKSKTWDKAAADRAMALERSGADPRAIWSETGTFKGADGKWRQEIDDSGARVIESAKAREFMAGPGPAEYPVGPVGGLLDHPSMGSAYPDAMAIKARLVKGEGGAYIPNTGFGEGFNLPSMGTKSTTLHELQHAIQQREGFARGGSPESMMGLLSERAQLKAKFEAAVEQARTATDPIARANAQQERQFYGLALGKLPKVDNAQDAYLKLAGEAEARAVQSRMNLTPAQRRALFPLDSYDVPQNALIVR